MKRWSDVLIVGSGPSAAYAVMACMDAGVDCDVISNRPPNVDQAGAFFLHWLPERWPIATPIPVHVWGAGTREGYLMKQWGPAYEDTPTSFPEEKRVELWYPSPVLNKVWHRKPVVVREPLKPEALVDYASRYRAVFHTYSVVPEDKRRKVALFPTLTHTHHARMAYGHPQVIYNGQPAELHVRTTVAWGRMSVEFPAGTRRELLRDYRGTFKGTPDLVYLRDIPPGTAPVRPEEYLAPNVIPLGRFARWDRRRLSFNAYHDVLKVLAEVAV